MPGVGDDVDVVTSASPRAHVSGRSVLGNLRITYMLRLCNIVTSVFEVLKTKRFSTCHSSLVIVYILGC